MIGDREETALLKVALLQRLIVDSFHLLDHSSF